MRKVLVTGDVPIKGFIGVDNSFRIFHACMHIGDTEGENMCKNSVRNLAPTSRRRLEFIKEGSDGS